MTRPFIYLDCKPQSKPLSRVIPPEPGDFARVAIHFPKGCVEVYASVNGAVQMRYGPPPGAAGTWTELAYLAINADGLLRFMPQTDKVPYARRVRWDT